MFGLPPSEMGMKQYFGPRASSVSGRSEINLDAGYQNQCLGGQKIHFVDYKGGDVLVFTKLKESEWKQNSNLSSLSLLEMNLVAD